MSRQAPRDLVGLLRDLDRAARRAERARTASSRRTKVGGWTLTEAEDGCLVATRADGTRRVLCEPDPTPEYADPTDDDDSSSTDDVRERFY